MWAAQHCSILFSSGQNRLCVFCCVGIGEVPRRIIAKSILKVVGNDVQEAAGPVQACAGHEAGCEAAIHAMKEIMSSDETQGVLLVDASNAFNTINRQAALHNIGVICPSISTVLNNILIRYHFDYLWREGEK